MWYALAALPVVAALLFNVAVWFDWPIAHSGWIIWPLGITYFLVLHSVRRFVDPKYPEIRAVRRKQPTAEESLKAYPKWW